MFSAKSLAQCCKETGRTYSKYASGKNGRRIAKLGKNLFLYPTVPNVYLGTIPSSVCILIAVRSTSVLNDLAQQFAVLNISPDLLR